MIYYNLKNVNTFFKCLKIISGDVQKQEQQDTRILKKENQDTHPNEIEIKMGLHVRVSKF